MWITEQQDDSGAFIETADVLYDRNMSVGSFMIICTSRVSLKNIQIFCIGCLKDRHQWWGREFRCSLSLNMDKLFPKAIINVLYH